MLWYSRIVLVVHSKLNTSARSLVREPTRLRGKKKESHKKYSRLYVKTLEEAERRLRNEKPREYMNYYPGVAHTNNVANNSRSYLSIWAIPIKLSITFVQRNKMLNVHETLSEFFLSKNISKCSVCDDFDLSLEILFWNFTTGEKNSIFFQFFGLSAWKIV